MRFSRLGLGLAVTAAAIVMTAGSAVADPPSGTPAPASIVGVGSDTIQNVMDQFAHDYNASHPHSAQLVSWDATNPKTGAIGDNIKLKAGCITEPRPDGSGAGVTALASGLGGNTAGHPCVDFARSSSDRSVTAPPYAPGGVAYVTLAGDAVTYATQANSAAPGNLTTAQITSIYECQTTNWDQVGGKNAPIHAFLPQSSSGTRSFFLSAIGVSSPGSCVSDGNNQLEENEGTNRLLHDPDAIFPYSIGKYLAQKYHSAACGGKPGRGKNLYGCDTHGSMVLHSINGTVPTSGSGAKTVINSAFTPTFVRTLFEVVRFASTADHIPSYLEPVFGANGWVCKSPAAKADLLSYGFIVLPSCGRTH